MSWQGEEGCQDKQRECKWRRRGWGSSPDAREELLWHGEAVPAWPRRHQARGRRQRYTSMGTHTTWSSTTSLGRPGFLERKLMVTNGESLVLGGDRFERMRKQLMRFCGWAGAPSRDLPDVHHLGS
jgi:hypothetical protein